MDSKTATEWWTNQAENVFRDAFLKEFFGGHLFETDDRRYYSFGAQENGDAVWIVSSKEQNQVYEVVRVEEASKYSPQPNSPRSVSFHHCVPISLSWLDDRELKRIESELKQGAQSFAQKVNKAFIDVLKASISEGNKVQANGRQLDDLLAEAVDELAKKGFRADKFLFPEVIKGRFLQQQIIVRDGEIKAASYVGKTITGQDAFSSTDLPAGTSLILDSSATICLQSEPRFERIDRLQAFTPGVCSYLDVNPIVKNTEAVIAIEGVQEALMQKPSEVQVRAENMYIDLSRIAELKAITSPQYDLSKLVRLCEELNKCYANECYLAVIMLTRAVLDHVPPIFGHKAFNGVANNYSGQSFKKSMQHLQNSSRNIADSYLHLPIRKSESLPTMTQINFANDLDVLLAEIVRLLK